MHASKKRRNQHADMHVETWYDVTSILKVG